RLRRELEDWFRATEAAVARGGTGAPS
ncbi:MAG: hypothetical protein JWL78_617, partial [Chloroflexi bacterium]|nr:hypothetical protein [Chloroflexota bacterium]